MVNIIFQNIQRCQKTPMPLCLVVTPCLKGWLAGESWAESMYLLHGSKLNEKAGRITDHLLCARHNSDGHICKHVLAK